MSILVMMIVSFISVDFHMKRLFSALLLSSLLFNTVFAQFSFPDEGKEPFADANPLTSRCIANYRPNAVVGSNSKTCAWGTEASSVTDWCSAAQGNSARFHNGIDAFTLWTRGWSQIATKTDYDFFVAVHQEYGTLQNWTLYTSSNWVRALQRTMWTTNKSSCQTCIDGRLWVDTLDRLKTCLPDDPCKNAPNNTNLTRQKYMDLVGSYAWWFDKTQCCITATPKPGDETLACPWAIDQILCPTITTVQKPQTTADFTTEELNKIIEDLDKEAWVSVSAWKCCADSAVRQKITQNLFTSDEVVVLEKFDDCPTTCSLPETLNDGQCCVSQSNYSQCTNKADLDAWNGTDPAPQCELAGGTSAPVCPIDSEEDVKCTEWKEKKVNGKCVCDSSQTCCGIKLNTVVPFIGNCIEFARTNDLAKNWKWLTDWSGNVLVSDTTSTVNPLNAFPFLIGGLSKIMLTGILLISFAMAVVAWVQTATGDATWWRQKIRKIILAIALLGSSGVLLAIILPNFFG